MKKNVNKLHQSKASFRLRKVLSSALICSLLLAAIPAGLAFAGDCDGTSGNDNIACLADPTVPDGDVGLDLGDDTYTQDETVFADSVSGDGLADGSDNTGDGGNDSITIDGLAIIVVGDGTDGNGGADTITLGVNGVAFGVAGDDASGDGGDDALTIDGSVFIVVGDAVDGNGGNDTIVINGEVKEVLGDSAIGNGGNDTIIINGEAEEISGDGAIGNGGNDTIIINGEVDDVAGDDVDGNGGDDTIIINGTVYFDVTGDCAGGDGGNDSIKINGSVDGDVLGDCVGGAGGDDTVTLGEDAVVGGVIDGEAGFDTLKFKKLKQSQLTGLDPAAGSITVGGKTYTWLNFESLIGLLAELVEQGNLHVYFSSNKLLAVDSDSGDGINVFAEHGRIAFIAFDALGGLEAGESPLTFQTPNSVGWFVTVTNLGPDVARPGHDTLLVRIFNAAGSPAGQFELSF